MTTIFAETPDALHILDDLRVTAATRSSFIIGVDGYTGAGKTSFATWLGASLSMPVLSLDDYLITNNGPVSWRFDELNADVGLWIIVEGARLCAALQAIDRKVDARVWVDNCILQSNPMSSICEEYLIEFDPIMTSDHCLTW